MTPTRPVALLDVNVLIALLDSDHVFHERAIGWFTAHGNNGWASCPITENDCNRIMSHPRHPNPLPTSAVIERLAEASREAFHVFWADDFSLLDATVSDPRRILGSGQVTDIYLLGLTVRHRGLFVTFDARVDPGAVYGADEA